MIGKILIVPLIGAAAFFGMEESLNPDSNNALAFDVHCHLEIIDQNWVTSVTVSEVGQDPVTIEVDFPNGTTEDVMALLVHTGLENALGAAKVCLKEVANGPDLVIVEGASISATVGPKDETGEGHIELEYSNNKCGSGPIPPGTLISQIEIELLPFVGADLLFSGVLVGTDSGGSPVIVSGSVVLPESGGLAGAVSTLLAALQSAGFSASTGSGNTLLIGPGSNSISNFKASLAPVLDSSQPLPIPLQYGMRVDHQV